VPTPVAIGEGSISNGVFGALSTPLSLPAAAPSTVIDADKPSKLPGRRIYVKIPLNEPLKLSYKAVRALISVQLDVAFFSL